MLWCQCLGPIPLDTLDTAALGGTLLKEVQLHVALLRRGPPAPTARTELLGWWRRFGITPFCHVSLVCKCPFLFSWSSVLAMAELPLLYIVPSPPRVVPHPLLFPGGGWGTVTWSTQNFRCGSLCCCVGGCVVGRYHLHPLHSWQDILLTFA